MSKRADKLIYSGNRAKPIRQFLLTLLFLFGAILVNQNLLLNAAELNKYPLDTLYHRSDEILPAIRKLADLQPDLVTWEIIGESSNEKLPIYTFRISNPRTGPEEIKSSLLFHGQHHSEEPIGVEIIFYLSNHFLAEYGKDRFITYLIDNYNLWFIPTINPEGFRIVSSGKNRLKRKNNTDTNMNGIFEMNKDGVDLNRNYPFNWEDDDNSDPETPYFKGHEPASQDEVRTMVDFYAARRFQLAFFYHSSISGSYSERIFFPWRWGEDLSPDYEEMLHLSTTLAGNLPRLYSRGNYIVHQFNTSRVGFARDYIYSQYGTLAMLIEVGGNSPYGEGVVSPPNSVLTRIKRDHTQAMIRLLQEYDKNLLIGRVIDLYEFPIADQEIILLDKHHPLKENLRTNQRGYFFYYLMPSESPFNLTIADQEFSLFKDEDRKIEYTFYIETETEIPFFKKKLNDGEAIIMTNPVFQYFPALSVEGDNETEAVYLSIMEGVKIRYRQEIKLNDGSFNIPWLPGNLTKKGLLTIQTKDMNPLIKDDNNKINNKIVFLSDDQETLTYAGDYNRQDHWYLHHGSKLGIDYTLYPSGDNNFLIEEVRIHGDKNFRSSNLEIILYSGAEKIYQNGMYNDRDDYISYQIPNVPLPDNLFLVLSNRGYQPHSIYRERALRGSSERQHVHYAEWVKLAGKDLAVEILLKK